MLRPNLGIPNVGRHDAQFPLLPARERGRRRRPQMGHAELLQLRAAPGLRLLLRQAFQPAVELEKRIKSGIDELMLMMCHGND